MEELIKSLDGLEEVLNEEIRKVTKKADITPTELENMTKTLCLIEKIKMIREGDSYWDEGSSSGMRHMNSYGGPYGNSYGNSYGGPYWNSYGMQPDYRDGWRYGASGTRGYRSYGTTGTTIPDHGYSGHSIKDRMIAKLESMYDEAKTEHERQVVDEWIARLSDDKDRR